MRRIVLALLALALLPGAGVARAESDLARYVNPFVGTLGGGFAFPGAAAPYGMAQNSPDTEGIFAYTGYQYADQFIRGFSLVHVESMGVREGGALPFMPTTGDIVTDVKKYQSKFDHASEEASPGYYRARLTTYGIDAELTAGTRVAMDRFTFPPLQAANVLIDVGRQIAGGDTNDVQSTPGTSMASVTIAGPRTVTGTTAPLNPAERDVYAVHFAARFDRDFTGFGVWDKRGAAPHPDVTSVTGEGAGAYVRFDPAATPVVTMKVGISFVSEQNALENLDAELPGEDFGFDALRARTRAAWNEALHAIVVEGGTDLDKTSFYTALYHAQHHPNVFNDANGEYLGHDGLTHQMGAADDPMPAGTAYYANFSLWDTYRAEMPLLELIAQDRVRDMMRSLKAIYVQGGRLPRWSLMNKYADYMIGEPVLQTLGDAFCRGVVPDDAAGALYEAARALAFDATFHDGADFRDLGYVPNDHSDVGASTTLEFASGHFAFATMADRLGYPNDRDRALAYARNWRNVFDSETRFVRPKNSDGAFVAGFHPELPDGFKEGTSWQWTWLVPQDVRGLVDAMGAAPQSGDAFVRERLDTFFAEPAAATVPFLPGQAQSTATVFGIAYYGNQYAPSNEHDLEAPYVYDWVGQPWKAQALARQHQGLFRPTPDGLPGNDDLGTMSAWFVWSALGFYPEIPGAPIYTIGSPMFERATIRLPAGTFTVEAPGATLANKYVQSATLNGEPQTTTWFTHGALGNPGTISFAMGPVANEGWASDPSAVPPSMSTSALTDFACAG